MFKLLLALAMTMTLHATTHYIVLDLSKGMKKSELKDLKRLAVVEKKGKLFKHGDKVKLLYFKGNDIHKKSFVYYEYEKKENGYKKARRIRSDFLKKQKKS